METTNTSNTNDVIVNETTSEETIREDFRDMINEMTLLTLLYDRLTSKNLFIVRSLDPITTSNKQHDHMSEHLYLITNIGFKATADGIMIEIDSESAGSDFDVSIHISPLSSNNTTNKYQYSHECEKIISNLITMGEVDVVNLLKAPINVTITKTHA